MALEKTDTGSLTNLGETSNEDDFENSPWITRTRKKKTLRQKNAHEHVPSDVTILITSSSDEHDNESQTFFKTTKTHDSSTHGDKRTSEDLENEIYSYSSAEENIGPVISGNSNFSGNSSKFQKASNQSSQKRRKRLSLSKSKSFVGDKSQPLYPIFKSCEAINHESFRKSFLEKEYELPDIKKFYHSIRKKKLAAPKRIIGKCNASPRIVSQDIICLTSLSSSEENDDFVNPLHSTSTSTRKNKNVALHVSRGIPSWSRKAKTRKNVSKPQTVTRKITSSSSDSEGKADFSFRETTGSDNRGNLDIIPRTTTTGDSDQICHSNTDQNKCDSSDSEIPLTQLIPTKVAVEQEIIQQQDVLKGVQNEHFEAYDLVEETQNQKHPNAEGSSIVEDNTSFIDELESEHEVTTVMPSYITEDEVWSDLELDFHVALPQSHLHDNTLTTDPGINTPVIEQTVSQTKSESMLDNTKDNQSDSQQSSDEITSAEIVSIKMETCLQFSQADEIIDISDDDDELFTNLSQSLFCIQSEDDDDDEYEPSCGKETKFVSDKPHEGLVETTIPPYHDSPDSPESLPENAKQMSSESVKIMIPSDDMYRKTYQKVSDKIKLSHLKIDNEPSLQKEYGSSGDNNSKHLAEFNNSLISDNIKQDTQGLVTEEMPHSNVTQNSLNFDKAIKSNENERKVIENDRVKKDFSDPQPENLEDIVMLECGSNISDEDLVDFFEKKCGDSPEKKFPSEAKESSESLSNLNSSKNTMEHTNKADEADSPESPDVMNTKSDVFEMPDSDDDFMEDVKLLEMRIDCEITGTEATAPGREEPQKMINSVESPSIYPNKFQNPVIEKCVSSPVGNETTSFTTTLLEHKSTSKKVTLPHIKNVEYLSMDESSNDSSVGDLSEYFNARFDQTPKALLKTIENEANCITSQKKSIVTDKSLAASPPLGKYKWKQTSDSIARKHPPNIFDKLSASCSTSENDIQRKKHSLKRSEDSLMNQHQEKIVPELYCTASENNDIQSKHSSKVLCVLNLNPKKNKNLSKNEIKKITSSGKSSSKEKKNRSGNDYKTRTNKTNLTKDIKENNQKRKMSKEENSHRFNTAIKQARKQMKIRKLQCEEMDKLTIPDPTKQSLPSSEISENCDRSNIPKGPTPAHNRDDLSTDKDKDKDQTRTVKHEENEKVSKNGTPGLTHVQENESTPASTCTNHANVTEVGLNKKRKCDTQYNSMQKKNCTEVLSTLLPSSRQQELDEVPSSVPTCMVPSVTEDVLRSDQLSVPQEEKKVISWPHEDKTKNLEAKSLNISHKAAIQKNRPLPATHSSELKGRSFCNKNLPAAKVQTQHKLTVDNFIEKILKWTPKWLQEQEKFDQLPPILGDKVPFPLLETYDSFDEYVAIMTPLLLLECWEQVYNDYTNTKKGNLEMIEMSLLHIDVPKSSSLLNMHCQALIPKTGYCNISEEDLIILHVSIEGPNKTYEDKHHFALVEKRVITNNIKFATNVHPSIAEKLKQYPDLAKSSKLLGVILKTGKRKIASTGQVCLQKIGSIVQLVRQYNGLISLQRNPLCRHVLRPQNARVFQTLHQIPSMSDQSPYNPSQYTAIYETSRAALEPYTHPRLCMMQGPPGTGKSHTIVGMIVNILRDGKKMKKNPKILLCAPSNGGIDELTRRLILKRRNWSQNDGPKVFNLIRIGRLESVGEDVKPFHITNLLEKAIRDELEREASASMSSIKSALQTFNGKIELLRKKHQDYLKNGDKSRQKKVLSEIASLEKRKDTVTNFHKKDVVDYARQQKIRRKLIRHADVVCCTLNGSGSSQLADDLAPTPADPHGAQFTCIIVDEASQCTEFDCLVPLQYGCSKLFLVGDPYQLPATVISQKAKELYYAQSLFERLYNNFKLEDDNPVMLLDTQYRMHPDISYFPNHHVYDGKLKDQLGLLERRRNFPFRSYIFFDVLYSQEKCNAPGKLLNSAEADFVVELCTLVLTKVPQDRLGVITPYREQVNLISDMLSRRNYPHVVVGTVDSFQGRELDAIVLSCVRANNASRSIGFVADQRRLNVSLTRAKYALYVIGHIKSLSVNGDWQELILDAQKRKRIITVNQRQHAIGAISTISRSHSK